MARRFLSRFSPISTGPTPLVGRPMPFFGAHKPVGPPIDKILEFGEEEFRLGFRDERLGKLERGWSEYRARWYYEDGRLFARSACSRAFEVLPQRGELGWEEFLEALEASSARDGLFKRRDR